HAARREEGPVSANTPCTRCVNADMPEILVGLSFDYLLGLAIWLLALTSGAMLLLKLRRNSHSHLRRMFWLNLGLSLWTFLAFLTAVELFFAFVYDQSDAFNSTNVSKRWFDRHVSPDQQPLMFQDGQSTPYRDDQKFPTTLAPGQRHI